MKYKKGQILYHFYHNKRNHKLYMCKVQVTVSTGISTIWGTNPPNNYEMGYDVDNLFTSQEEAQQRYNKVILDSILYV